MKFGSGPGFMIGAGVVILVLVILVIVLGTKKCDDQGSEGCPSNGQQCPDKKDVCKGMIPGASQRPVTKLNLTTNSKHPTYALANSLLSEEECERQCQALKPCPNPGNVCTSKVTGRQKDGSYISPRCYCSLTTQRGGLTTTKSK